MTVKEKTVKEVAVKAKKSTLEEIHEAQRKSWNKFALGWKKWDHFLMEALAPIGKALLEAANLKKGDRALDVATGTGEPGLTAARWVGDDGVVIGVDLSEEMIAVAAENAKTRGITNYHTQVVSDENLPFEDKSFDGVLCRLGVMFFPNPQASVAEFARVVKPKGVVALATWTEPSKNPWASIIKEIVDKELHLPVQPPDAPGLFRFANPVLLRSMLDRAGLRNIKVSEVKSLRSFESPQHYWQVMTEVAAPIASALSQVDQATRDRVRLAVIKAVQPKVRNGQLPLPWNAWIISGTK